MADFIYLRYYTVVRGLRAAVQPCWTTVGGATRSGAAGSCGIFIAKAAALLTAPPRCPARTRSSHPAAWAGWRRWRRETRLYKFQLLSCRNTRPNGGAPCLVRKLAGQQRGGSYK